MRNFPTKDFCRFQLDHAPSNFCLLPRPAHAAVGDACATLLKCPQSCEQKVWRWCRCWTYEMNSLWWLLSRRYWLIIWWERSHLFDIWYSVLFLIWWYFSFVASLSIEAWGLFVIFITMNITSTALRKQISHRKMCRTICFVFQFMPPLFCLPKLPQPHSSQDDTAGF